MKHYIKQSSIFIFMSIMLFLISPSNQEITNIIEKQSFIHAPKGDFSKSHEDFSINYLNWDGSKWSAKFQKGKFLHAPNGDWSKVYSDNVINYLNWDGSKWTSKLKNTLFVHSRYNDLSKSHTNSTMNFLTWDRSQWTVKINERYLKKYINDVPIGWVNIIGVNSLCAKGSGKGERITQAICENFDNMKWKLVKLGNDFIITGKSGYVIENAKFRNFNGNHVVSNLKLNEINQKWQILPLNNKKFLIKNIQTNKCLDTTAEAREGRGYHIWDCSEKNIYQQFKIEKLNKKRLPSYYKIETDPKNENYIASIYRLIREGKTKMADNFIRKLKSTGKIDDAKKLDEINKKSKKLIEEKTNSIVKEVEKLIKSGKIKDAIIFIRDFKTTGKHKAADLLTKKYSKDLKIINQRRKKFSKRINKFRRNFQNIIGYNKRRKIKLIGGKYKFNLSRGSYFCQKKCSPDEIQTKKKCLKNTLQDCFTCKYNGGKEDKNAIDYNEICSIACNSITKENTCDFYAYLHEQKVFNANLLKRSGLSTIIKILLK